MNHTVNGGFLELLIQTDPDPQSRTYLGMIFEALSMDFNEDGSYFWAWLELMIDSMEFPREEGERFK